MSRRRGAFSPPRAHGPLSPRAGGSLGGGEAGTCSCQRASAPDLRPEGPGAGEVGRFRCLLGRLPPFGPFSVSLSQSCT